MIRRTPLKRTPWKRRPGPGLKRTPLARESSEKGRWRRKYSAELRLRKAQQVEDRGTTFCERCERNRPVDGHHPGGQIGAAILVFFLICRRCHDWIHFEAPGEARSAGWLR